MLMNYSKNVNLCNRIQKLFDKINPNNNNTNDNSNKYSYIKQYICP